MKKVAIVTTNRAEYGILTPLIKRVYEDPDLELSLLVTGAHLEAQYGSTINHIKEDGFPINACFQIMEDGNRKCDISKTIANAILKFADYFSNNRPDVLVLLGDRTELLGVAIAAMNENIMMAHIHGGEVTEGAVDDCVRHALTKMCFIHYAGTEVYRKRIIQLGEHPDRVFNYGTLSAENILTVPLLSDDDVRRSLNIDADRSFVMVTLHPETVNGSEPQRCAELLCECMGYYSDYDYIITASNPDAGGEVINEILERFSEKNKNCLFVRSLGMRRYLSALKHALFVLGNSSSGILEAPILGTPTVNIGDRQKGRLMADTVINASFDKKSIKKAMACASKKKHLPTPMYGDGKTSEKIVASLKRFAESNVDLKKTFFDISFINKVK